MRVWRRNKKKNRQPVDPFPFTSIDPGWLEVAATLLVVQAGIGMLSALAQVALGLVALPLSPIGAPVAVGVPIAMLATARGVLRRRRWARRVALWLEIAILVGAAARFLIGKELAFGLMPVSGSVLLPLAVTVALYRPESRRAMAAARAGHWQPTALPVRSPRAWPADRAA